MTKKGKGLPRNQWVLEMTDFFHDNERKRIEGRGGVEGAEVRPLASGKGVLVTTKS